MLNGFRRHVNPTLLNLRPERPRVQCLCHNTTPHRISTPVLLAVRHFTFEAVCAVRHKSIAKAVLVGYYFTDRTEDSRHEVQQRSSTNRVEVIKGSTKDFSSSRRRLGASIDYTFYCIRSYPEDVVPIGQGDLYVATITKRCRDNKVTVLDVVRNLIVLTYTVIVITHKPSTQQRMRNTAGYRVSHVSSSSLCVIGEAVSTPPEVTQNTHVTTDISRGECPQAVEERSP